MLKNIIANIRFIKLKGLENFFYIKIFQRRNYEINNLVTKSYVYGVWSVINWLFPSIAYIIVVLWLLLISPNLGISYVGPVIRLLLFVEQGARNLPFA